MAKLPLLRDIAVVKRYTECVQAENQRTLQRFIEALTECYSEESVNAVRDAIAKHPVMPLTHRTVQNLRDIAEHFHGKGAAKPLARHAVFRVWPYKWVTHPGHASLTVKNKLDAYPDQQKAHISWGPATLPENSLKSRLTYGIFDQLQGASRGRYRDDKLLAVSDRTAQRLEQGFNAGLRRGDGGPRTRDRSLDARETYRPYADQKRYIDESGRRAWGKSAKKLYMPLMGRNEDPSANGSADVFIMFGLDEYAMREAIDDLESAARLGRIRYIAASKTQNCAAVALSVLRSGGAEQFVPFNPSAIVEDPNRAYVYAEAVQTKIDTLNRQVAEIDRHCSLALAGHAARDELAADAGDDSIGDLDVKALKQQMTVEKNRTKRAQLRLRLKEHLAVQVDQLSKKFDAAASSQPGEARSLIDVKRECTPTPDDHLGILSIKAKALVEATHRHLVTTKDPASSKTKLLVLNAMIKCIADLMMLQMP
ncbi:hypothetical protein WJ69_34165 [Burkholderia ubonensis]|nr:hypothetical protein WJ69_34165 [Burkholderia ubonensis]